MYQADVQVMFQRPGMDDLAAWLFQFTQRDECAIHPEAGFLLELAPRGFQRRLASFRQSLRNRPGAVVLSCPEWPAGMRQQDPQPTFGPLEQENAVTMYAHAQKLTERV